MSFVLTFEKGETFSECTVSKNIPIYFDKNYHTEMSLVPFIMDYCLLQFDAVKLFLGVHKHGGGSLPNFSFSNVNLQNL